MHPWHHTYHVICLLAGALLYCMLLKHICAATQLYLPCYVRISYTFILLLAMSINAKAYLYLVICVACGAICHCLPCHMPYNRCYITLHGLLHIRAMQCALTCYMPSCYCLPCYISPPCNMQVAGGRHSLRRIATTMPFTKSGKPTKKKSYIGKSMDQSRIGDQ